MLGYFLPHCIFRNLPICKGLYGYFKSFFHQKNTIPLKIIQIISMFIGLLSISMLLNKLFTLLCFILPILNASFIFIWLLMWLLVDNLIILSDLNQSIENEKVMVKENQILMYEVNIFRNNHKNSNRWLYILFLIQTLIENKTNSNNTQFHFKRNPMQSYFRLNTKHLETAEILDRTMYMNQILTYALSQEKQKNVYFPKKKNHNKDEIEEWKFYIGNQ
jgi:hypothetical protein